MLACWPLMIWPWSQTVKRGSNPTCASPVAVGHLLLTKPLLGRQVWCDIQFCMVPVSWPFDPMRCSFLRLEEGALISVRILPACFSPVISSWFGFWIPLTCCGGFGDISGTAVNWLCVLVVFPPLFSQTETTHGATAFCIKGKADEATSDTRGENWFFFLEISREVCLKGTLVVITVLACVLTAVAAVGLSAWEQVRGFPPSQGEDWLVGMAALKEDLINSEGLRFRTDALDGGW